MNPCPNTLANFACVRDVNHPGACKSESGHWWAQYDSGRVDKQPFNPPTKDSAPVADMRGVWS